MPAQPVVVAANIRNASVKYLRMTASPLSAAADGSRWWVVETMSGGPQNEGAERTTLSYFEPSVKTTAVIFILRLAKKFSRNRPKIRLKKKPPAATSVAAGVMRGRTPLRGRSTVPIRGTDRPRGAGGDDAQDVRRQGLRWGHRPQCFQ